LRVNFENFGHTTKNKIFRLVKLLADLSTRLKLLIKHDYFLELYVWHSYAKLPCNFVHFGKYFSTNK